jgi:hypothetical protein
VKLVGSGAADVLASIASMPVNGEDLHGVSVFCTSVRNLRTEAGDEGGIVSRS